MRHAAFLTVAFLVTPLLAQSSPDDAAHVLDADVTVQQTSEAAGGGDDLFDSPNVPDSTDTSLPASRNQPKQRGRATIPNPFDLPSDEGMSGYRKMMMGGMDDMQEMGMGSGMDMGGMGMEYGGSEMYKSDMYGDGGDSTSPADRRFQIGLQRAIQALRSSKSEADQKVLLSFVRQAFQNRYDESIQSRRKELGQIKERVAKLEGELKRREAAKSRVVEVQLQSVQLAAEGLLELDGQ